MLNNFLFFTIGGAALINLFIGFYILLNNYKKRLNQLFFYLTIGSAIWILFNFLMAFWPTILLLKSAYAFGIVVISLGVIWVYYLIEERLDLFKVVLFSLVGITLFSISYVDNWLIKSASQIYLGGFEGEMGPLFPIYLLFAFLALFIIVYKLAVGYKKSFNLKKIQLKYVLIGGTLFVFASFMVSFLLPFFGYKKLMSLDSVSSLFFTGFIFLAVFKYKFLNPKAIVTALLTFAIWIFLLMRTLLAETLRELMLNGTLLILVILFGILLIKSVLEEVEHREKLEALTKELQATNEKLRYLDKVKSEFLSFASHQVKAPMTIVKGFAQLIYDGTYGRVSKKVKEAAKKIVNSANKMIALVENLLDLRKIDEGKMEYNFAETDVVKLTKDTVEALRPMAQDKKLDLTFTGPANEIKIKADSMKLSQVIQNFVDNAIKYTDAGWIRVSVKCQESSVKDKEGVLITVSDSGRGLSLKLQPHLFEQFSRDSEMAKEIQGTGLGLYIAKQIVEAHRGKIWAESEGNGKGSTFFVELPLR